jgi:hypothetical protein
VNILGGLQALGQLVPDLLVLRVDPLSVDDTRRGRGDEVGRDRCAAVLTREQRADQTEVCHGTALPDPTDRLQRFHQPVVQLVDDLLPVAGPQRERLAPLLAFLVGEAARRPATACLCSLQHAGALQLCAHVVRLPSAVGGPGQREHLPVRCLHEVAVAVADAVVTTARALELVAGFELAGQLVEGLRSSLGHPVSLVFVAGSSRRFSRIDAF